MSNDHDNNDKWAKISSDIADGKAINWNEYQHLKQTDPNTLAQLNTIDSIAKILMQHSKSDDMTDNSKKPALFNWQHSSDVNKKSLFTWGHLQVLEKIGHGSFGDVYRAYDSVLNREVALKLRRSDRAPAAGSSTAFLQEARRLARIRQRNVIAVHGAAYHEGQVGIWTDLLEGENLKHHFLDQGTIDGTTIYNLILDIAHALAAVHEARIVHGDVKSSNIMLQDDGKFVLMDFGAGGELYDESGSPTTGTPLVMAPELFKDSVASAASDQYSFGAMLYQILSGKYPFEGQSVIELEQAHANKKKIHLHKRCPKLPKGLCDLVDSLLSISPRSRPSAKQVIKKTHWLLNAPKRFKRKLAITSIIASLSFGIIISSWGYINANQAKKAVLISNQELQAVNGFLASILKSARPNESGKNTPVSEILETASQQLKTELIQQPLARAQLLHHIGSSYYHMQENKLALPLLEQAHSIRLSKLDSKHPKTLATQAVLGGVLVRLNRFDEAQKLLFIDTKTINNTPLESNQLVNFLQEQADYYSHAGDFIKSEKLIRDILPQINLNTEPKDYYKMRQWLANSLTNQLRFEQAELILQEVLTWAEGNYPRSGLALNTRSTLASILARTKRPEQAEILVRKNIDQASAWLGAKDPFVINAFSLLSNILRVQDKSQESLDANSKALALSKEVHGNSYWLTLRLMGNQANRLFDLGEFNAAKKLFLQTIHYADEAKYPKYKWGILPRINLTRLYLEQGEYSQGLALAKITLPIVRDARGEKHRLTIKIRYFLGSLLSLTGEVLSGEKELKKALDLAKDILGKDHKLTVAITNQLAKIQISN